MSAALRVVFKVFACDAIEPDHDQAVQYTNGFSQHKRVLRHRGHANLHLAPDRREEQRLDILPLSLGIAPEIYLLFEQTGNTLLVRSQLTHMHEHRVGLTLHPAGITNCTR